MTDQLPKHRMELDDGDIQLLLNALHVYRMGNVTEQQKRAADSAYNSLSESTGLRGAPLAGVPVPNAARDVVKSYTDPVRNAGMDWSYTQRDAIILVLDALIGEVRKLNDQEKVPVNIEVVAPTTTR